jgi:hypothetical protein
MQGGKPNFSFCKKSSPNKKFLLQNDKNSSASAQRQATHSGKILGRCNFSGGYSYNILRSQLMWHAL